MVGRRKLLLTLVALTLCVAGGVFAAPDKLPKPNDRDLCPVCGMLVAKYPNWLAIVVYKDGHAHFFDGAKDLFKYLGNIPRYAPGHRLADIAGIWVTEFYGLTRIDARQAFYVVGSDTLGPMGNEFVPLATRADAEDFLKDHKGWRIIGFAQATQELAARLDQGSFD
jgi:copper chaperone NosL